MKCACSRPRTGCCSATQSSVAFTDECYGIFALRWKPLFDELTQKGASIVYPPIIQPYHMKEFAVRDPDWPRAGLRAGLAIVSPRRVPESRVIPHCRAWAMPLFIGSGFFSAANTAAAQRPLAFAHVSVIDGESPTVRLDQTVIIRGTRIESVASATTARIPADARVVDARGKYLVPGFWDMHVHTAFPDGRKLLALYVANGVTGVRDMAGDWDTLTAWRREIARGTLAGPRIVASGPYIEGGDVPVPHLLARNAQEAKVAVDSLVALGVDFIKVHGQLTPGTYYAIARRARERRIAFAGHVSRAVGSANASDSGQKSIEHLLAIPAPCTPVESIALAPRYPVQGALGRCSSVDLAPLYAKFVHNGTWVTPTFVAQVEIAGWPASAVPGDSLASYLPVAVRRFVAGIFPMPDSIPPGADFVGRAMLMKRLRQVNTMHDAGVHVLTGTDAPLRNSPPGFGLHEEFTLLARGGMSAFDILRAATIEPAIYLGLRDSLGAIAPAQIADLVLLDANPLRDIRNTRRIVAVVRNGRLIENAERRLLLRSAADRRAIRHVHRR